MMHFANHASSLERYKQVELQNSEQDEEKDKKNQTNPNSQSQDLDKKKIVKPKNPIKSFKRLISYTMKNKGLLFWGLIGLLFASLSSVVLPYLAGQMIDAISQKKDREFLEKICIQFLLCAIIMAIASMIRGLSLSLLGEKVMLEIRSELYDKLLYKDTEFFDIHKSGELMSRITSDTALIQSAASDNLSIMLRNMVQFVGSLVLLWIISWELTLILLLIVPPFVLAVVIFIKKFKQQTKEYQDHLAKGNSQASEALSNIRVVKSFATEHKESQLFSGYLFDTYQVGKKKSILYGVFILITILLGNGAILTVLWYGGEMVLDQKITTGDLTSFVLYTITLSIGVLAGGGMLNIIISAVGIAEQLMDVEPKIKSGFVIPKEQFKGNIKIEQVSFSYPTKSKVTVLKNININIKSGDVIALVGASGSGKSSIVSLLQRFYDAQNGSILYDGIDIKQYDSKWLHERIGFVSQEPTLFSGTLEQNITYGVSSYTIQDIEKAMQLANASEFVHNKLQFPEGLQTIVGERGIKLSGGQKQRIAIARSLIKKPQILIFDEATSALDAESEFQVQQAIDGLVKQGDKTIIIIAHRLSTIINCQRILLLENGLIVEEGDHKTLLNLNGQYKKLIERQLAKDNLGIN